MGKNSGKAGTAPPTSEAKEKPVVVVVAEPSADASLSNWLAAAKDLGSAKPQVSVREPEDDVSDDDDLASLDERELQLARLQAEGGDWLSEFDEDEYDEDGEEEDSEQDDGEGEEYDLQPVKRAQGSGSSGDKGGGPRAVPEPTPASTQPQAKAVKSQELAKGQPQKQAPAQPVAAAPAAASKPSKPAHSLTASAAPVVSAQQVAVIREQSVAAIVGTKRGRPQDEEEEEEEDRKEGAQGKAAGSGPPGKRGKESEPKRPLPPAFAPDVEARAVFLRNLPFADQQEGGGGEGKAPAPPALKGGMPALVEAVSAALRAYGKVSRVHIEVSNSGKQCSFGYAEFKKEEGARAAAAAPGGVAVAGRTLEVLPYTPALNYRNPDGSRRKEKSQEKKDAQKAANAARMAEKQGQGRKKGR